LQHEPEGAGRIGVRASRIQRSFSIIQEGSWSVGIIAADPRRLFEQETEELHLSSQFKSLLEPFVPAMAKHDLTGPLTA
jgi:hypothetical protein